MLTLEQGTKLVKLARHSIKTFFKSKNLETLEIKEALSKKEFSKKQGVFVTIHTYPEKELRGCIGLPYPTTILAKAVIEASRSAAFSDPRFYSLRDDELPNIIIEISVLTEPKIIDCKSQDLPKNIKIGKDGLICKYKDFAGLLLPQVPLGFGWTAQEFIEQTCIKAGLPRTVWKNKGCEFYKFQAQIFSEETPKGKIVQE